MNALHEIVLGIAQQRSVPLVLQKIVDEITDCPESGFVQKTADCADLALVRIWLVAPGDICAECVFRSECLDQTRCLHLAASAGESLDRKEKWTRLDDEFRRFPLGVRKIGHIAARSEPIFLPDISQDSTWVVRPEWAKKERITSFAGLPLVFRGETVGVLAVFSRTQLRPGDDRRLQNFANHATVAIANARAFEEIEFLKARLEEENSYLREEVREALGVKDLVGESLALRKVLQQVQLVAPTEAAVLIMGESGTGKELVARALHEQSSRRERALIKVNCGAIPENLFESEFFGHMRGSFTGAVRDKPGRFELADGGTLFLDEVGEIPLSLQAKLLRVVQEKELERIGDTRTRKVNVRIIAATNRDLVAEVEAGRFRQDLYYRLSVFPIQNPPLRERREDIPRLAEHFIRAAAQRLHRKPPKLTQPAVRQLVAHDWPGNVRELQNAVERAVILAQSGPLQFDHLAPQRPAPSDLPAAPLLAVPGDGGPLTRSELRQRERTSLIAALAQTRGKIFGEDGAAALLGMKPTTLASRLKALGIARKGRSGSEKAV